MADPNPPRRWHLLSGEYPPAPGGVSDYTRLVARGLAAAGDAVDVWAPAANGAEPNDQGVRVHRLPGIFGWRALRQLDDALKQVPSPRTLFVQYVPHAFGYKGMNIGLCRWLLRRRQRERIWVMFHEVCYPRGWERPLRHNLLGTVQRWMAAWVARAASKRFLSIPGWETLLPACPQASEWLPIPSTFPTTFDPVLRDAIRRRIAKTVGTILGHLGTYGPATVDYLTPALLGVLQREPLRRMLLIGRGSVEYAARLPAEVSRRVTATGGLEADALPAHLAACDVLLQFYSDGASTRRTSLMAGIALGLPVVTNRGPQTEPVWGERDAVCLVDGPPAAWMAAIETLLASDEARQRLGRAARALYNQRFTLERTIAVLQGRYDEDLLRGGRP